MCAIEAGKRGRRRVLCSSATPSSGRRSSSRRRALANFTNLHAAPEELLSATRLRRSALARYTPGLHRARREARHPLPREDARQLFCDGSARRASSCSRRSAAASARAGRDGLRGERRSTARRASRSRRAAARPLSVAGGGDRRPLDPEARRHGFLRCGSRRSSRRAVTESGPAGAAAHGGRGARVCAALAGGRSARRFAAADRRSARTRFHASRAQRPAVAPGVELLAAGRGARARPVAGEDAAALLAETRERGRGLVRLTRSASPRRFAQAFAEGFAPPGPLAELRKPDLAELAGRLHAWR